MYIIPEPLEKGFDLTSKYAADQVDTSETTAAFREVSFHPEVWHPRMMDRKTKRFGGWIFVCS
jgi:hypothetical protein